MRVACDGADASADQLHAGMAWVFDRYVTDHDLYAVQDEAQSASSLDRSQANGPIAVASSAIPARAPAVKPGPVGYGRLN